jgi:hypothetical protein
VKQLEFFPLYVEQIEEDDQFKKLSPLKKTYYFLIQSMANKFGEFYDSDMFFAAALNCSDEAIKKARREFVKKEWIEIVPGRRDKQGRNLATQYKSVKWSTAPKKGDNKQFAGMQRYALEMLLKHQYSHESIVVYITLSYWRNFHRFEEGDFFIQKSKLRELTGIDSQGKIEKCLDELYNFQYSGGVHLFEFKDKYHTLHFDKWATPGDPTEDENNREIQKRFWERIKETSKSMQKEKDMKAKKKELSSLEVAWEMFEESYMSKYGNKPSPHEEQITELLAATKEIGLEDMKQVINHFFNADHVPGMTRSQRRTLGKFLSIEYWRYVSC